MLLLCCFDARGVFVQFEFSTVFRYNFRPFLFKSFINFKCHVMLRKLNYLTLRVKYT